MRYSPTFFPPGSSATCWYQRSLRPYSSIFACSWRASRESFSAPGTEVVTHTHEPGCAVLQALDDHLIAPSRYQSYLSMLDDKDENKYREAY